MFRNFSRGLVLGFFLVFPSVLHAQNKPATSDVKSAIDETIKLSSQHLSKGESCFASGDVECARREFDAATDMVLSTGIDVRADRELSTYWRQMIERINRFQRDAFVGDAKTAWKVQEFRGVPPVDQPAAPVVAEVQNHPGPLTKDEFQERFQKLQAMFQEKFGRPLVVTAADDEEHRRLYGSGSAYDIRVRDLTAAQVGFILDTGRQLGMRVKDFSTWDKVQSHNARASSLGLPSDVMATAVHIHIDRETTGLYEAKPVVKTEIAKPRE